MTAPEVSLGQGRLRGKTGTNYLGEKYFSFQGIPYARPPVGELRFKDPQPPEPWSGILDATKEGPECPSKHMILGYYVGDENGCLNLNVYTRNLPQNGLEKKPVMFWIHGGGFVQGSNKTEFYDPEYLLMEDVVIVTINYRLGVLGFLSLEDSSLQIPGNAGLKDQVMALKWVQNNIELFNGDKNNITIFGESAGGASIHYLVLSPLCKGLFHKAIVQSGCTLNYWAHGMKGVAEISNQLGLKETDERKVLEYLRKTPSPKLVDAWDKSKEAFNPAEKRFYGPVIEKPSPEAFISEEPENLIKSGNYNKVPMIWGFNSMEGFLFEAIRQIRPEGKLPCNFELEVSYREPTSSDKNKRSEMGNKIKKFYFGEEDATEENLEKTYLLKTDTTFVYGLYKSIQLHQKTNDQPMYVYKMTVDTSLNMYKKVCTVYWLKAYFVTLILIRRNFFITPKKLLQKLQNSFSFRPIQGVSHADDLSYLWKMFWNPEVKPGSLEDISIRRFVKLWTNFAKYGNPTPSNSDKNLNVQWTPTDEDITYLNLGKELSLMKRPDEERMKFWDDLYSTYAK